MTKLCVNGSSQSPIDIEKSHVIKFKTAVHLLNYDQTLYDISFISAGFTPLFYDIPKDIHLESVLLDGVFQVEEIHFHWLSEHTIDGKRFDLEVQIFHKNERYPNLMAALKEPNGVTVISLLYTVGETHNEFFETLVDALQYLRHEDVGTTGIQAIREKPLILGSLLTGHNAIMYRGSLNRPPCMETVNWIVALQPDPVPQAVIDELKLFRNEEGKPVKNNYRDIQPRNSRVMTGVYLSDDIIRMVSGATAARISKYVLANVAIFAVSYARHNEIIRN